MTNRVTVHVSKVDNVFLNNFCLKYNITPEHKPTAPLPHDRITDCPDGYIALYTKHFDFANLRIPFSNFFLNFLKQYNVNISQLSPMGAIKVSHFEIACRALGGEPSLPLFRQFFLLARYGDWFTVEKRKAPAPSCVTSVPKKKNKLNEWRDYFFWVSADVIPFKMPWRQANNETLNVIDHRREWFDEKLYLLLVEHKMPAQPFHEHVLVMTGVSRNWPHPNAAPVIMDGDKEMSLLKYIEKRWAGPVNLTSRVLGEHEVNILDRTRGICYEAPSGGQVQLGNINSFGGDVPEHMMGDSLEPVRMLDLLLGSDIAFDPLVFPGLDAPESLSEGRMRHQPASSSKKRNNAVLVSSKNNCPHADNIKVSAKRRRTKIVFSESGESSSNEAEQTPVNPKYVPESDHRLGCLAHLVGSVPGWYGGKAKRAAHSRDRICRYRQRITSQHQKIAKLTKKVRKLKNLKKTSLDHKGKEHAKGKLKQVNVVESVIQEMGADRWRQERVSLEKSLEQVTSERKWLIEEGFEYVINRLHRSEEYLKPLGAVLSKFWSSAAHAGVVAGYAQCKDGVDLKDVGLYKPKAEEEFLKAVHELEQTQFPYIAALSHCTERTLDDLKALEPIGMEHDEDEVDVK